MIRMGRTSKDDESGDSGELRDRSTTVDRYSAEYGSASNQALSESETMARDIKEGRLNGYVGHGTVLTGETIFKSLLRVDGHLTGKVVSEDGTLIVGTTGQVDADVTVSGAVISGTVNGDVIATDKLELGRTARVVGNIQSPRLIIEDGALLEGNCSMIQPQEEKEQLAAELELKTASASESYSYRNTSEETKEITSYDVKDAEEIEDADEDDYADKDDDDDEAEESLNASAV